MPAVETQMKGLEEKHKAELRKHNAELQKEKDEVSRLKAQVAELQKDRDEASQLKAKLSEVEKSRSALSRSMKAQKDTYEADALKNKGLLKEAEERAELAQRKHAELEEKSKDWLEQIRQINIKFRGDLLSLPKQVPALKT